MTTQKRFYVRRASIGWEIWDRQENARIYHGIAFKRNAQDQTNSLNYWAMVKYGTQTVTEEL